MLDLVLTPGPAFAFCSSTSAVTQCQAESQLCNTSLGWKLCPASSYQQEYGSKAAPIGTTQAWIAGCVRDEPNPQPPSDSVCTCYIATVKPKIDLAWDCQTSNPAHSTDQRHVGLVTYGQCRQVGDPVTGPKAFWIPRTAMDATSIKAAVCCK